MRDSDADLVVLRSGSVDDIEANVMEHTKHQNTKGCKDYGRNEDKRGDIVMPGILGEFPRSSHRHRVRYRSIKGHKRVVSNVQRETRNMVESKFVEAIAARYLLQIDPIVIFTVYKVCAQREPKSDATNTAVCN